MTVASQHTRLATEVTGPPRVSIESLLNKLKEKHCAANSSKYANVMLQLFQMARDGNLSAFLELERYASNEDDKIATGYTAVLLTNDRLTIADRNVERADSMMQSILNWLLEQVMSESDLAQRHAHFLMGFCFSEGYGLPINLKNAFYHLSIAANKGNPAAQNNVGLAFCKGIGTDPNFRLGAFHYQQSNDQFNTLGEYNSGVCFVHGTGVRCNEEEALKRFRRAAAKGHRQARSAAKALSLKKNVVSDIHDTLQPQILTHMRNVIL